MMRKAILASSVLAVLTLAGCGFNGNQSAASSQSTPRSATSTSSTTFGGSTPTLKSQNVSLTVLPGSRLGPDGKMHDTVTDPNFTVVEGVPVRLTVYNYDGGSHSITNSALGLNLQAKGSAKPGVPGVTSVTFTPTKAGDFTWQCMDACDGQNNDWAMSHKGYMEGDIHVVPSNDKQYVYLTVKDGLQYAAADGKFHDSFSPADFTVQEGIPVQVTVENFDSGQHSITSPELGLNQVLQGAKKDGMPTTTTFTFTPTKEGTFHWMCVIQCDGNGWAMTHDGYMAGNITVTQ